MNNNDRITAVAVAQPFNHPKNTVVFSDCQKKDFNTRVLSTCDFQVEKWQHKAPMRCKRLI